MESPLPDLNISYDQLRSLILEYLSTIDQGQLNDLLTKVANLAVKRGFYIGPEADPKAHGFGQKVPYAYRLTNRDYYKSRDIIWDLIIEGIIRPGPLNGEEGLPFFHVTDYGKKMIKDRSSSPYDPDGYLQRLYSSIPNLDVVIRTYIEESLRTFRNGCFLSSTITLGCASEKALLLLFDAYANSMTESMREKYLKEISGKIIKKKIDEFDKRLKSHLMAKLPDEIKEHFEVSFTTLSALFRELRIDVGHPSGKTVSSEQAHANLIVFPLYIKKVYDLIQWLDKNSDQDEPCSD